MYPQRCPSFLLYTFKIPRLPRRYIHGTGPTRPLCMEGSLHWRARRCTYSSLVLDSVCEGRTAGEIRRSKEYILAGTKSPFCKNHVGDRVFGRVETGGLSLRRPGDGSRASGLFTVGVDLDPLLLPHLFLTTNFHTHHSLYSHLSFSRHPSDPSYPLRLLRSGIGQPSPKTPETLLLEKIGVVVTSRRFSTRGTEEGRPSH